MSWKSYRVPRDEHLQGLPMGMWLRHSPIEFVRTAPFVALIADLHEILQNQFISNRDAYIAVRRAARLLAAFVEEAERKPRPGEPTW